MYVLYGMVGLGNGWDEGWVGCDLEIENGESLDNWVGRNAILGVMWLGKKNDVTQKQYWICYSEIK